MPKLEVGTEISGNSIFFDSLPEYWQVLEKHAFDIIWNSLLGPRVVKRLKDGKHFKVGDMTNFGKITHFPCYRDLDCVIVQNQNKYYNTSSVHIDELQLLDEDSKTPFEKYGKASCVVNAKRLKRKLNKRIQFHPTDIECKTWKEDLLWIEKWINENPENKQTPFEKRGLQAREDNALKILQSLEKTIDGKRRSYSNYSAEMKDKNWIEDWLKQNTMWYLQSIGRQHRKNSVPVTYFVAGVRGFGKTKYQQELIDAHKKNFPRDIIYPWFSGELYLPKGLGKTGFQPKPPLGIIPKEIHDENRLNDINNAIDRYVQASKDVPAAWLIEKKELETKLKQK